MREIVHSTVFTWISLFESARRTPPIRVQREEDKGRCNAVSQPPSIDNIVTTRFSLLYYYRSRQSDGVSTESNDCDVRYRCTYAKSVATPPTSPKSTIFIWKKNIRTARRCSNSTTRDTSSLQTQTLPTCCFKYAPNIELIANVLLDWPKC